MVPDLTLSALDVVRLFPKDEATGSPYPKARTIDCMVFYHLSTPSKRALLRRVRGSTRHSDLVLGPGLLREHRRAFAVLHRVPIRVYEVLRLSRRVHPLLSQLLPQGIGQE